MRSKAVARAPRARHPYWPTAYAIAVLTTGLAGCSGASQHPATPDYRLNLERKIALLEQRKTALQDVNDIKRLQRAYGYYVDAGMWDQVADLFAENGTVEFALDGVYRGKARVRQYFYALGGGKTGLSPGQVSENFQLMPVIDLGSDGRTAKGTWRSVILTGELGTDAFWGEGPYENEYVKENGTWKISSLHWYQTLRVPYAGGGWTRQKDANGGKYVSGRLPPDSPPTVPYETWPATFVPPFHFKDKTPGPLSVGAGAG
ncbi:MAG TPA: nuclear transport factor 2 family protein, partial [Steroidobacteraceae bacterium]